MRGVRAVRVMRMMRVMPAGDWRRVLLRQCQQWRCAGGSRNRSLRLTDACSSIASHGRRALWQ